MAHQTAVAPSRRSFIELSAKFVKALADYAAAGLPRSSTRVRQAREAKCAACPDKLRRGADIGRWCADCGCYLAPKVRMATEACPRGHWPAEIELATVSIDSLQAKGCDLCG